MIGVGFVRAYMSECGTVSLLRRACFDRLTLYLLVVDGIHVVCGHSPSWRPKYATEEGGFRSWYIYSAN